MNECSTQWRDTTEQPTARAFDLVMFDLDGTLVQTAPEICDAVNDTMTELDLPWLELQQVKDWIGHGTRELVIRALAHAKNISMDEVRQAPFLAAALARFDEHYLQRCGSNSQLFPYVRETLLALKEQGIRLAVVTNKDSRYTRIVLDTHWLTPLFDHVVCGDSFPAKKPNPQGVYACLMRFGVAPQRALFVGDSAIDVATARNANVAAWVLPYGYNMGQPVADSRPDRLIPDLRSLVPIS